MKFVETRFIIKLINIWGYSMCFDRNKIIKEIIKESKNHDNVVELSKDNYIEYFEKFCSERLFRGIKEDFHLYPTILRSCEIKKNDNQSFKWYEENIYKEYDRLSIQYLPYYGYLEDWLANGQHWGLPTRLLDWTYDPYVALYFAINNSKEYDNVYILETKPEYELKELINFREKVDEKTSQNRVLNNLFKNLEYLDCALGNETVLSSCDEESVIIQRAKNDNLPLFIKTHYANPRLIAQSGMFEICVFPRASKNVDELKEYHIDVLKNSINKIYVIHKDKFDEMKELLNKKHINRVKLFPDLQNICKYISETVAQKK